METAFVAAFAAVLGVVLGVVGAIAVGRLRGAHSRRRLDPTRARIEEHLAAISAALERVAARAAAGGGERREQLELTLDFGALLQQVVAQASALTGAQAVAIRVEGPGGEPVVASFGTNDGAALLETALGPPDARPFRALTINWTYGPTADDDAEAYSSALVVPVVEDGVTTGALVAYAGPSGGFESEHLRALRALADEAAAGIANARRFTELDRRSLTDPVTGIRNRSGYELELEREVARAHRTGRPLSLLLVELRAAESVEAVPADTELALQELAALVKRTARAADIPCRRRANELAIVLPETRDDGAQRFYARLLQETSSSFGPGRPTTYSVGLVEWHPDETSGALDARAALALRRTGANGSEAAEDHAVATTIELGRARRHEPSGRETPPPMDPRGALLEHLAREIDEARRNGAPLTVAALEIDELRAIEQRVGRAGADALRAHVTARIDDCADEGCVVSRLAADRYAIVFPGASAEHAQNVLAVLQASLELGPPDQEVRILLSAGIGELSDPDDPPSLLRRAEQALRRARTTGGGSVVVATST
jgi:diguanylate cyclase (GGDEF)-like protein